MHHDFHEDPAQRLWRTQAQLIERDGNAALLRLPAWSGSMDPVRVRGYGVVPSDAQPGDRFHVRANLGADGPEQLRVIPETHRYEALRRDGEQLRTICTTPDRDDAEHEAAAVAQDTGCCACVYDHVAHQFLHNLPA